MYLFALVSVNSSEWKCIQLSLVTDIPQDVSYSNESANHQAFREESVGSALYRRLGWQ